MKRTAIITAVSIMFFSLFLPSLFSLSTATVQAVSGKVEVKAPQRDWERAVVGMKLVPGTTISTGFRSEAQLDIGGSELLVNQLTRMQLEELVQREGTQITGLYLRVGRVKARVKSVEGLQHDFKLRSPVSTAAVRGTDFDYDGYILLVREGIVELYNRLEQRRSMYEGESGAITGDGFIETNLDLMEKDAGISIYTTGGGITKTESAEITGGIIISWD